MDLAEMRNGNDKHESIRGKLLREIWTNPYLSCGQNVLDIAKHYGYVEAQTTLPKGVSKFQHFYDKTQTDGKTERLTKAWNINNPHKLKVNHLVFV